MEEQVANFDKSKLDDLTFGIRSDTRERSKDDRRNKQYWKSGSLSFWSDQTFEPNVDLDDDDTGFISEVTSRADSGVRNSSNPAMEGLDFDGFEERVDPSLFLGPDYEDLPWEHAEGKSKTSVSLYFQDNDGYASEERQYRVRITVQFTVPAEKPSQLPDDDEMYERMWANLLEVFEAARESLKDAYDFIVKRDARKERQRKANDMAGHYVHECYEKVDEEQGFADEIEALKEQIADLKERRNEAAKECALEQIEEHRDRLLDPEDEETGTVDEVTVEAAKQALEDDEQYTRNPLHSNPSRPSRTRGQFGGARVTMEDVVELEDDE